MSQLLQENLNATREMRLSKHYTIIYVGFFLFMSRIFYKYALLIPFYAVGRAKKPIMIYLLLLAM